MIDLLLEAEYGNSVTTWANSLVTRIQVNLFVHTTAEMVLKWCFQDWRLRGVCLVVDLMLVDNRGGHS